MSKSNLPMVDHKIKFPCFQSDSVVEGGRLLERLEGGRFALIVARVQGEEVRVLL